MNILYFLLIGLAAGFIAGWLTKGSGFGLVGNLIVGVLGAFIGGFVLRVIGLIPEGLIGELIAAVVGALILLFLLGLVAKRKT